MPTSPFPSPPLLPQVHLASPEDIDKAAKEYSQLDKDALAAAGEETCSLQVGRPATHLPAEPLCCALTGSAAPAASQLSGVLCLAPLELSSELTCPLGCTCCRASLQLFLLPYKDKDETEEWKKLEGEWVGPSLAASWHPTVLVYGLVPLRCGLERLWAS